jgi:hypothetical protein
VSTDAHTPVPIRPSAAERERAVRDRSVEGRLSTDTFAERVALALRAKSPAELAGLTSDVRPSSRPRRALLSAVEWLAGLRADVEAAWRRPHVPSLALPGSRATRMLVGRAANCDCVLPESCVSRRHAQLWRDGERWYLRELGSRNGTRVNGVRVIEPTEVRPGDRLDLGGASYRLSPPRPKPDG